MLESTHLRPPRLRVDLPNYPVHIQLCRVYGGVVGSGSSSSSSSSGSGSSGPNVYNAFVEQWTPGPTLRDREACYVWEPNGNMLSPGYYLCRLDGVYPISSSSLPLFVTVVFLGGGTITGNLLVVGAVLSGLSAAQAAALISNLTTAQIKQLYNLNPCQLQTFLNLTTTQQQTLTSNLTPSQLTSVVDGMTASSLPNFVGTLTTAQLITIGGTLTPEQTQVLTTALTPAQIQTLLTGGLTTTQLQKLTYYPPVMIRWLVPTFSIPALQTILNLATLQTNPGLTPTRIPYTGTDGNLTDKSTLTFTAAADLVSIGSGGTITNIIPGDVKVSSGGRDLEIDATAGYGDTAWAASSTVFTTAGKKLTTTGTVGETSGGTGQATYTTGDILYASASNTLAKLAIGSSGKVLTVAAGVPSWATSSSNVTPLFDHFTDAGNVVATGETTLYSDSVVANTLATSGDKLEAEYAGTFVSSATATRQVRIYFAGTLIFDTGTLTLSLSSAWTVYASLITVSKTTVRCGVSFATEGAALSSYTSYTEVTGLDTTVNNYALKITGEAAGIGAADNDIVAKMGDVQFVAHA